MPPLRLNVGLPLLVADVLIAGVMDFSPWRSLALTVGIALALWMAYSLRIPSRHPAEAEEDLDAPALDDPDPSTPEPLRPLNEEEQKELEHEATRHTPRRRP